MRRIALTTGLMIISAASAGGCAAFRGVSYPKSHPVGLEDLPMAQTAAVARIDPEAWPVDEWWRAFNDPQLDQFEAEALDRSPSLKVARARVDQAQATVGILRASLYPRAEGNLNVARERFSAHDVVPPPYAGTWQTESRLSLDFGYEFDFWGRNRAGIAAALSDAAAARAEAYAARLLLATALASVYVDLARTEDRLAVEQRVLLQRTRVFDLTGQLVAEGLGTRVELKQAEAEVPAAKERIAALEASAALARYQMAALSGQGPDRALKMTPPHLTPIQAAAVLPSAVSIDLLGRRPDVEASRLRAAAAAGRVRVARAGFYPDVNLVAFLGLGSIGLSELVTTGSRIAGLGPAVRLPLFEGGRLRGELEASHAEYDAAVEQYNETVTEGLREVADQLTEAQALSERMNEQALALAAAREANELSERRYLEGVGTYLSVLATESLVLEQERSGADLRAAALDLHIHLVRALGGGFHPEPATSPSSP